MTYEEFEARATVAKATEVSNLWDMVSLAALAAEMDEIWKKQIRLGLLSEQEAPQAVNSLANLWHRSGTWVRRKAALAVFPQDLILPWVSESLYRACLEVEEATNTSAVEWLRRAIDNDWKERELRDAAGIAKGKKLSDVKFASANAETVKWDVDADVVAVHGLGISGAQPERVKAQLQEVLA